jgi:hypothetical protein
VRTRPLALLTTIVVSAAACGGPADEPEPASLAPQFAPDAAPAAPDATTAAPAPPAVAADPTGPAPPPAPATTTRDPAAAPVLRASTVDRRGDVTPAVGDDAPGWADLTGADLLAGPQGFELRVSLADDAPGAAPDGERTMNVAAFFDVDGDGVIDYEVWANLAEGGWGGAWYDDRAGTAAFTDDSGVTAGSEDGVLVIRFPADHVGGATEFRWSVASEWGRHATIGTVAAARDDAPDGDDAVTFPA